jgi:hypothetical protein
LACGYSRSTSSSLWRGQAQECSESNSTCLVSRLTRKVKIHLDDFRVYQGLPEPQSKYESQMNKSVYCGHGSILESKSGLFAECAYAGVAISYPGFGSVCPRRGRSGRPSHWLVHCCPGKLLQREHKRRRFSAMHGFWRENDLKLKGVESILGRLLRSGDNAG